MGDSNGGVCRIHALSARATGPEHVDSEVSGIDRDIDLFRLRKDRHRHGRRVNAPLGFSRGYALNPMHAAFPLQLAVHAGSLHHGDDFLETTNPGRVSGKDFNAPALLFRVPLIHPKKLSDEKGRLISAGTRADFEHDVLFVVRILRQQQNLEPIGALHQLRLKALQLLASKSDDLVVPLTQKLLIGQNLVLQGFVPMVLRNELLEVGMLLRKPSELSGLRPELRVGEP